MENKKFVYEILVIEYKDLREEVRLRLKQIDKYTELSLIVIGAYIAIFNNIKFNNRIILVGFPIVLFALMFLTIKSDYMILNNVQFIYEHLKPKLENILMLNDDVILQWEIFRYTKDLKKSYKINFLSTFLTGVRYGIPFLSIIIFSVFYILKYHKFFDYHDYIVLAFFVFGLVFFLCVIIIWLPYCSKSYKELLQKSEQNKSKNKKCKVYIKKCKFSQKN